MREAVERAGTYVESSWKGFAERLYYSSLEYSESTSFEAVSRRLKEKEAGHSTSSNRLIYLSPLRLFTMRS